MKPWYQYRVEEVYSDKLGPPDIMYAPRLGERLKRFFIRKMHFGGIIWQYSAGWSDWRGIYGSIIDES